MQTFLITLLICSVTMSVLALLYMASTPFLAKRYSPRGRYYVWLIIMVGLIIPFRPQWSNALVSVEVSTSAPPPVVYMSGEVPGYVVPPVTLPPMIDNIVASETALNISWWQIGFMVWAAGLIMFIAYHGIKHYLFAKTAQRWSKSITNEQILSSLERLKSEMGIKRRIPIYLCTFAGSPMMIGLIKPRILLPTVELTQDELHFILKHELVHYKRKDLLYKYLVMAATALHWFNPVVYMMARAVNVLCETSCDAEVLRNADESTRQSYGETIIGVVQYHSKLKTALSTNFYGGKNSMNTRISSILDTSKKRMGAAIMTLALVATLATGFVFAVSAYAVTPPDLTVEDATPRNVQRAANTLTADEAAQYAAQHIYEMFGVCVDGSVVQVNYNARDNEWEVTIADSAEEMAELWRFRITLDARDGEWVSFQRNGRGLNVLQPGETNPIDRLFPRADSNATVESWFIEADGQRINVPEENIRMVIPIPRDAQNNWRFGN